MAGSFSQEGTHIFTSSSRPLVAKIGIWGCGSKQFTYNKHASYKHIQYDLSHSTQICNYLAAS